jgi:hypothetical protein
VSWALSGNSFRSSLKKRKRHFLFWKGVDVCVLYERLERERETERERESARESKRGKRERQRETEREKERKRESLNVVRRKRLSGREEVC